MNQAGQPKPRHCMIVHAYYPLTETRVEREALALIDSGFEVDVICLQRTVDPAFEQVDGVNVYRLPVRREKAGLVKQLGEYLNFFFRVFFKLIRLHTRRKYQVVQVHNPPDFLVFSTLYPKLTGAKIFLDLHDIMPEFFASKTNKRMDSFMVRLVLLQERLSCWFADHVITVTEIWRERLSGRGVNPDKLSVVMNVADERYFHPQDLGVESNGHDRQFNLIYHGTLKENYGLGDLIRSIGLAREKIPNIHLTIQGVGEYYSEMMEIVDQLDIHQEVTINPYALPVNELPALINKADLGVVPNQNDLFNGDLLPTKMLEYIALGKPVIAAKTKVISHYFDETMVQFFEPGNPESLANELVSMYHNWEKVIEKGRNYQKFTSQYNWSAISQMYVALVREYAGADK